MSEATNSLGHEFRPLSVEERRDIAFKVSIWVIHQSDPESVRLLKLRQRGVPVDAIIEELSSDDRRNQNLSREPNEGTTD